MLKDRNLELDNECIFDKCKFTLSEIVEFIIWLNKIIVHKCKFLFGGNGLPSLKSQDTSQAFLSRLVILYFPDEIPESERDPDLDKKLYKERHIIFSLAVRELPELISNNFIFEMPDDYDYR